MPVSTCLACDTAPECPCSAASPKLDRRRARHALPVSGRRLADGTQFGHSAVRSRFGYLCAEGMVFGREGRIDPETWEVLDSVFPVVPSHYKSPSNEKCMNLADPFDWSTREEENA